MWPNFQNHHGRIFPAQRTARGICPQHVDGLGVKTDEMRAWSNHIATDGLTGGCVHTQTTQGGQSSSAHCMARGDSKLKSDLEAV